VVQVLCGLGWIGGGPLGGELGWGEVAVGGVGPLPVVVDAPVLDDTRASRGLSNCQPLRSSSRNLPLKNSIQVS